MWVELTTRSDGLALIMLTNFAALGHRAFENFALPELVSLIGVGMSQSLEIIGVAVIMTGLSATDLTVSTWRWGWEKLWVGALDF